MSKILVVDDDPMIQKYMQEILSRHGYTVITAKDGVEAMACARDNRPDLIMLDVMMPHMDGYDVCRAIKADPKLEDIPIILLTSLAQDIQTRSLSSLGIGYLNKTCKTEQLLDGIKQALDV